MPKSGFKESWAWLDGDDSRQAAGVLPTMRGQPLAIDLDELSRAYARCFSGPDGEIVLTHLRRVTIERRLGAKASEAELRHVEAQRALVAAIADLAIRGRRTPIADDDETN